jgi:WD40 repeat protein
MPDNFDKAALVWTLPWDDDWVTAVAFAGATRRVAAGNNRGQILLYDLPEKPVGDAPPPLRRLDGHTNCISRLMSTPDGRWLISASYDHTVRVWDMQAEPGAEAVVALNARTREDLQRRRSSKIPPPLEAKVKTQPAARVLEGHADWIQAACLSADASTLLTGDDAGEILARNLADGKELKRWRVKGWAYAVALSPDKKLALVSERKPLVFDSGRHVGINLWDVETATAKHNLQADYKDMYIACAAYSADGKVLAIARGGECDGNNGKVWLLDPATGKKQKELTPGHQYGATDLCFHPDGKHLISAGRDTVVRIWSLADGKMVKELGKPRGGQFKDWIHAVSCSADGKWLAAADMVGAVQVWALG